MNGAAITAAAPPIIPIAPPIAAPIPQPISSVFTCIELSPIPKTFFWQSEITPSHKAVIRSMIGVNNTPPLIDSSSSSAANVGILG